MNADPESRASPDRLESAARWFDTLQAGDAPYEIWQQFLEWSEDPANAAAFQEVEKAMQLADVASAVPAHAGAASAASYTAAPNRVASATRIRRGRGWKIAAAAAVFIKGAVIATSLAVTGPEPAIYVTEIGARRAFTLPDGSVMTLNTNSKADVRYSARGRRIRLLQGQALFNVETDVRRPFTVTAGQIQTTALGTEFDVRADTGGIAITLIEGTVRVAPEPERGALQSITGFLDRGAQDSEGAVLSPGQQIVVTPDGAAAVRDVDVNTAARWTSGFIEFADTPLSEAIREINRYSKRRLKIEDAVLEEERISGVFPADKPDVFLAAIKHYLSIETVEVGNTILLRRQYGDTG